MKEGDYVQLHVLDHIQGRREALSCYITGQIQEIDKEKIVLCYWEIEDGEYQEENQEFITLIRSCVVKYRRVAKWSPWRINAASPSNQ